MLGAIINLYKPKRNGLADYFKGHIHTAGIIVSEKHKFIYMKPTKTAGSAILKGVFDKQIPDIMYKQSKTKSSEFEDWLKSITDEDLKQYFIFSVVRNPWDRFVSNSSYFKIPFNKLVGNYKKYWIDNPNLEHHSRPIHYYTHFNDQQFFDFICRFETLQADFNLVCDKVGLKRMHIPIINKSRHKHYSSYYNETSEKIVADIYSKDIEYYGYELEKSGFLHDSYLIYFTKKIYNLIGQKLRMK